MLRYHYLLLCALLLSAGAVQAQTGIGTTSPNPKAVLDLSATDKGLLAPRLTSTQRHAIATPPQGLLVFQTGPDSVGFWYATGAGTQWRFVPDQAAAADNLGNHTATQNLNLTTQLLVGNGGTSGLGISASGNVGIGAASPTTRLTITPSAVEPKITLWNGGSAVDHYGFGVSGAQLNYHVANTGASHVFSATGLNGDGREVMRIRGNGRVGIGTTAPVVFLHVRDTLPNTRVALFEGNNASFAGAYVNAMKSTAASFWGYQRQAGALGWTQVGTNNNWNLALLKTASTFFFPLTVTDSTGRVGIGTTNPQEQLHIYSEKPGAKIRLQSVGVGAYGPTGIEFWSDPTGSASEWRPSMIRSTDQAVGSFTGGLAFYVNGAGFAQRRDTVEVMRLTNNRVGIGTAAPISKLHIVSDNATGGGDDDYLLDAYGNTADPGVFMRKARGTVAAPQNVQNGDRIGIISFAPRVNGAMGYFTGSHIQAYYLGDGTTTRSDLRFYTNGSAEQMRITDNGHVGIGATGATTRLTITPGTVEPKITLWNGGSTVNHYGFGVSGNQLNYHVASTNDNHVFSATGLNGNGNELMRIKGNGKVGIGTNNPFSALHVRDTTSANQIVTYFEGNNSGFAGVYVSALKATAVPFYGYLRQNTLLGYHEMASNGDWQLRLRNTGGALFNAFVVRDSTGFVGLNATAPQTRLSINPTVTEPKITLWDGGSTTSHYGFGVSSFQLNYHVHATTDSHVFFAGGKNGTGTELLRILGTGGVRVGSLGGGGTRMVTVDNAGNLAATTLPTDNQNLSLAGQSLGIGGGTGVSLPVVGATNGLSVASGGNVALGGTLTGDISIATGGNDLSITGSGNVGIGTTAGTAKLDVGGDVRLSGEVHTTTTGTADMLAAAYAQLGTAGPATYSSSGNFSISKISTGRVRVTFTAASGLSAVSFSSQTIVASLFGSPGFVVWDTAGGTGTIDFYTYAVNGTTASERDFSFVVYRP